MTQEKEKEIVALVESCCRSTAERAVAEKDAEIAILAAVITARDKSILVQAQMIGKWSQDYETLKKDYESLEIHHQDTEAIIADARGLSPENGKALLHSMNQLQDRVQELERELSALRLAYAHASDVTGPESVKAEMALEAKLKEEQERSAQLLSALKWCAEWLNSNRYAAAAVTPEEAIARYESGAASLECE